MGQQKGVLRGIRKGHVPFEVDMWGKKKGGVMWVSRKEHGVLLEVGICVNRKGFCGLTAMGSVGQPKGARCNLKRVCWSTEMGTVYIEVGL